MGIREHPRIGTLLLCNFDGGFVPPEMVKRRPVVVISPKIAARPGLCTVVALSMTPPNPVMGYHCQIDFDPPLPPPMASQGVWVKGDMVYAVSLKRLDFIRVGKDRFGNRSYYYAPVSDAALKRIRACVLTGIGLGALTKSL